MVKLLRSSLARRRSSGVIEEGRFYLAGQAVRGHWQTQFLCIESTHSQITLFQRDPRPSLSGACDMSVLFLSKSKSSSRCRRLCRCSLPLCSGTRLSHLSLRPRLSFPLRVLATESLCPDCVSVSFAFLGAFGGRVAWWRAAVVQVDLVQVAVVNPAFWFDRVEVECLRGDKSGHDRVSDPPESCQGGRTLLSLIKSTHVTRVSIAVLCCVDGSSTELHGLFVPHVPLVALI